MVRFLDIIFSLIALIVFIPFLLITIIILKLTGEGEVFFIQERCGQYGEVFNLIKFATMKKNSPKIGTGTVTLKDDPRVLPVGKFLRTTKVNELPQLLNVLAGEMSIIGPRPQTQRCFNAFPKRSQDQIKKVRPGLSGVGSIIFRGEEQMLQASTDPECFFDHVIMPYKGLVEEWYVANQGLKTYVVSIFLTLWVIFFPRSGLQWRVFSQLPEPPKELATIVNFPNA